MRAIRMKSYSDEDNIEDRTLQTKFTDSTQEGVFDRFMIDFQARAMKALRGILKYLPGGMGGKNSDSNGYQS